MLWLLAPFVHTPAHAPPGGKWEVTFDRKEDMTPDGTYCAWEAESLRYGDRPLWSADAPEGEQWCQAPFEASRTVDVVGEDGPYLSVRLAEWGCCPDHEEVDPCVTYDVRTGEHATLEAYDPKHYLWRAKRLQQLLDGRKDGGGWQVDPTAFLVGGGHVKVCATRGAETLEIALR